MRLAARWRLRRPRARLAGTPAHAHGFGQRYELPLPLSLYLFGAAAVVALSFVVFGLFVRGAPAPRSRRRSICAPVRLGRILGHPAVILALRLAALALVRRCQCWPACSATRTRTATSRRHWSGSSGGSGLPTFRPSPATSGRSSIPGAPSSTGCNGSYRRLGGRGALGCACAYPPALGVWPACLLLLAFSWIELVYPNAGLARHIAVPGNRLFGAHLGRHVVFGRDVWLQHGEVFSLVFGTFARFAPIEATRTGSCCCGRSARACSTSTPVSPSMMAFVLLLLATVLYDGLIGTARWAARRARCAQRLPGSGDRRHQDASACSRSGCCSSAPIWRSAAS